MAGKRKSNSVSYRIAPITLPGLRTTREVFPVERIVSGGQTGVDRAALDFALAHGIPHGGWCPLGRLAEDGSIAANYELKETPDTAYSQRTEWNVRDADVTVILSVARRLTGGSALTQKLARKLGKPCLHLAQSLEGSQAPAKLLAFLQRHHAKVLNVAGPRLSTEPGARAFATQVLEALWPQS